MTDINLLKKNPVKNNDYSSPNELLKEIDNYLVLENQKDLSILFEFMGINSLDDLTGKVFSILQELWPEEPPNIDDFKNFDLVKPTYQIAQSLKFNPEVILKINVEDRQKFLDLLEKVFRIFISRGLSPFLTRNYPELIDLFRSKFGDTMDEIAFIEGIETHQGVNSLKNQFNRALKKTKIQDSIQRPVCLNDKAFTCAEFDKIKCLTDLITSDTYGFIQKKSRQDFLDLFSNKRKGWKKIVIQNGKIEHVVCLIRRLYKDNDKHPEFIKLNYGKGFFSYAQDHFVKEGEIEINTPFKNIFYKIKRDQNKFKKINEQLDEIFNQLK